MEKRDLNSDLKMLMGEWGPHESDWFRANGVEIAAHAIERAMQAERALGNETILNCKAIAGLIARVKKAEALNRELLDVYHMTIFALEELVDDLGSLDVAEDFESTIGWMRSELTKAKAKEVLGDEAT